MEGIAHGWKPKGMKKPPSKKVALKFHKHGKKGKRGAPIGNKNAKR